MKGETNLKAAKDLMGYISYQLGHFYIDKNTEINVSRKDGDICFIEFKNKESFRSLNFLLVKKASQEANILQKQLQYQRQNQKDIDKEEFIYLVKSKGKSESLLITEALEDSFKEKQDFRGVGKECKMQFEQGVIDVMFEEDQEYFFFNEQILENWKLAQRLLDDNQKLKGSTLVRVRNKTLGMNPGCIMIIKDQEGKERKYFVKEFFSEYKNEEILSILDIDFTKRSIIYDSFCISFVDFIFQRLDTKGLKTPDVDLCYDKGHIDKDGNKKTQLYVLSLSIDDSGKAIGKNEGKTYDFKFRDKYLEDRVVEDCYIDERANNQLFTGTLGLSREEQERQLTLQQQAKDFLFFPYKDIKLDKRNEGVLKIFLKNISRESKIAFCAYTYIFHVDDFGGDNVGVRITKKKDDSTKSNLSLIDSMFCYQGDMEEKKIFLPEYKEDLLIDDEETARFLAQKLFPNLLKNYYESINYIIEKIKKYNSEILFQEVFSETNISFLEESFFKNFYKKNGKTANNVLGLVEAYSEIVEENFFLALEQLKGKVEELKLEEVKSSLDKIESEAKEYKAKSFEQKCESAKGLKAKGFSEQATKETMRSKIKAFLLAIPKAIIRAILTILGKSYSKGPDVESVDPKTKQDFDNRESSSKSLKSSESKEEGEGKLFQSTIAQERANNAKLARGIKG